MPVKQKPKPKPQVLCPMTGFEKPCIRERCPWWVYRVGCDFGDCALRVIAESVDYLSAELERVSSPPPVERW